MESILQEMEKMGIKELIELNRHIAQRAKTLSLQERMEASAKFRHGQEVEFTDKKGKRIAGVVTQINRTTVDVLCDGTVWRVSGNLLSHTKEA